MERSFVRGARAAVVLVLLGASLQLLPLRQAAASPPPAPQAEAAPNQLLVGFRAEVGEAAREAAVARHGGRTLRQLDGIHVRLIELPTGRTLAQSAQAFTADPGVRFAEPNYVNRISRTPNDPYYAAYQWALKNTGQYVGGSAGTPGADISAESAWNTTIGSRGIVVGVVDSGIDYTHPDLVQNIWSAPAGWNLSGCGPGTHGIDFSRYTSQGTYDCLPDDENGHGTHVAGTIGATGNNGVGVSGVNWNVSIMGLKSLDSSGGGYTFDSLRAIEYAVQAKQRGVNVRALNASYGSSTWSQAEYDEIEYAGNNGILFVAAAGNDNNNNDLSPPIPPVTPLPTSSASRPRTIGMAERPSPITGPRLFTSPPTPPRRQHRRHGHRRGRPGESACPAGRGGHHSVRFHHART